MFDFAWFRALPAAQRQARLTRLTVDQQHEFLRGYKRLLEVERRTKYYRMFPETGALRRELYQKHLEFFRFGASKKFRLFLGATGCGKTEGAGGYEAVCHLTGIYPSWWEGKRFSKPVVMWIGANTNETFRDSVQIKLFGKREEWGTGLIPGALLGKPRFNGTPADSLDFCYVKHVSGRWSKVTAKPYSAGRESFEASDIDVIWLDEEPTGEIVSSASGRFRGETSDGILFMTYTPFDGITDVVQRFVPQFIPNFDRAIYEAAGNACVVCSSKDVPHETPDPAHFMPHEREARLNGIPSIGSGKIYPVSELDVVIPPFLIPKWFPRCFGADFGYGSIANDDGGTAVLWGAHDRENDIVYVYAEHFQRGAEIATNASAMRAKGKWIPGAGDLSGAGRDGDSTIDLYQREGIDIIGADKSVEAGLFDVLDRFTTGRLKIFNTCTRTINELRMYRRDEKGRVVKHGDHCLHPDTMVWTDKGKRTIKSLVGTSGRVLTAGGEYVAYENCRLTGVDKPTVEVAFSDGSRVVCTPEHLFLTADGWVQAQGLKGLGCYNAVTQSIQGKSRWTRLLSPPQFKSLRDFGTTFAASISSAVGGLRFACIGSSGKQQISALCLTDSLSTTLTRTVPTTQPTTCSSWPSRTIAHITNWGTLAHPRLLRWMQPAHGTGQRPVKSGTESTIFSSPTSFMWLRSLFASTVAQSTRQSRLVPIGFVPATAETDHASHLAWTMLSAFALGAVRRFQSIVTREPKTAQGNAGPFSWCVSVTPAGRSDVYCLEVPSTHAFAVEGGVVVHNCMDGLRYLIRSGLARARVQTPERTAPVEEMTFGL